MHVHITNYHTGNTRYIHVLLVHTKTPEIERWSSLFTRWGKRDSLPALESLPGKLGVTITLARDGDDIVQSLGIIVWLSVYKIKHSKKYDCHPGHAKSLAHPCVYFFVYEYCMIHVLTDKLQTHTLTLVVPNAILAADFSFVSKGRFGTYIHT